MDAVLPLYHPTTCLVIDDDQLFLDSFDYTYADVTLCATEHRPEQAIKRLLLDSERTALAIDDAFHPPLGEVTGGDPVVRLPASRIAEIARDPVRFARISVVVVDFAMPSMTGVELLRKIKHLPVKKVLLTGKAGDATAVDAFNEGLINLFLVKQDPDLPNKLRRILQELQHSYFREITAPVKPIATLEDTAFLNDPEIASWYRQLAASIRAVEHYVLLSPPGLMLVDEAGHVTTAFISNPDRMRAQLEIAIEEEAPEALLKTLHAGDAILACPTTSGFYQRKHFSDWSKYVLPCREIRGNSLWKVAIQQNPTLNLSAVSLRRYRQSQTKLASAG